MAVFRLQPCPPNLDDPAWTMSWHRKPCYVVAETAEQARLFAGCAFTVPLRSAAELAMGLPLPWSNPSLVEAWCLTHIADFGLPGSVSVGALPQPERVESAAA